MRLHIISPLRRTIDHERGKDGNLLHPHRSRSPELHPSPAQSVRHVASSYPTPPPLSPQRHETTVVRFTFAHFTHRNKALTCPRFSRLSKNKALTASTESLHREAATSHRVLQGTPRIEFHPMLPQYRHESRPSTAANPTARLCIK